MARKKAEAVAADEAPAKPAKQPKALEPHEVNDSLSSDRMKALLEDHRKMGSRP